ncbi:MAG: magnesium/cobalt transporter CorA [Bacteroidetes bacterium]|nr:magnesium/cobalt transporter CorA [Bacteroidota bacterium]MBS1978414.1 magnesium/cobalt transporter CorA [Bacteroidota bacterium]
MSSPKTQGIDSRPPSDNHVILELIQYNEKDYAMLADVPVEEILNGLKPDQVNWINVDGLHDRHIIRKLGQHFKLHPLLINDILSDHQPKAEEFEEHLFFTLKMLYKIRNGKIEYEQISFVLGKDYLISFQEKEGDLFGGLRQRIKQSSGRVRARKADYLLYRLADIIVDNYYSILDEVGKQIEQIEEDVYRQPSDNEFQKIQRIKKELIYLRKALYPLRDALSKLAKDESGFIEQANMRYFSDVYDQIVHLIDSMDTYKDLTTSLMDIHINTMNTRMNEVMKVLTVISTIFMPLTFIVGIYGMNFEFMPEIHMHWAYPTVMLIMGAIVFGMISYFKYRKWF